MSARALTFEDIVSQPNGLFHPVDHVVVAFDDEACADDAGAALLAAGVDEADIVRYSSAQWLPTLRRLIEGSPRGAGFGYEITLMRRYEELAREGAGWLVVHTSDDADAGRVADVAARFGASTAVRYHRIASEDLV